MVSVLFWLNLTSSAVTPHIETCQRAATSSVKPPGMNTATRWTLLTAPLLHVAGTFSTLLRKANRPVGHFCWSHWLTVNRAEFLHKDKVWIELLPCTTTKQQWSNTLSFHIWTSDIVQRIRSGHLLKMSFHTCSTHFLLTYWKYSGRTWGKQYTAVVIQCF